MVKTVEIPQEVKFFNAPKAQAVSNNNGVSAVVVEKDELEKAYVGKEAGRRELEKAVEKTNKKLNLSLVERHLEVDEELNRFVVKIVDKESNEVLRQIPTEDALRIAKNINEMLGVFLDDKV